MCVGKILPEFVQRNQPIDTIVDSKDIVCQILITSTDSSSFLTSSRATGFKDYQSIARTQSVDIVTSLPYGSTTGMATQFQENIQQKQVKTKK